MMAKRIKLLCLASVLLLTGLSTATPAQRNIAPDNDPSGRVARLNYLQGSVSFQPADEPEWVNAVVNRPVTTGDRLWADDNSRAEMHLGSSTIRLDGQTGMSFFNLDDRTTQIELSSGALNIRVLRLDRDEIFEVDTPNQAFSILRPGQYRIEASEDGNSTYVTVRTGQGEVTGGGRIYSVGAGFSGNFRGSDTLRASIYRADDYDEFDTWSEARDRHDDRSQSVRYVSPDLVGYQDLDDYGTWRVDASYGNVWMPRVATGWAPYHDGHWVWISPWGWTWVDDAPWGYAPFHYGRWVYTSNNWGWIPGPIAVRPVYAPALVAFIGGPRFSLSISVGGGGGGNVGWFPLGPREVYVPTYPTSRTYVDRVNVSNTTVNNVTITNVYNNTGNSNIQYSNRNVRGGVTAVSQTTFVNAQPVGRSVVVVNQQEIASAPINRRAEVAPTRNSVLGPSAASGKRAAQPPAAVVNRTVVAKTAPPPAPVPFEKQQARLAAQPGQPLARTEVEVLRPANVPAERMRVKQAPQGKPAQAESTVPVARPGNNASGGRGGSRGQQPLTAQPQATAPVPAAVVTTPPANNAPSGRGGNRPPQPANAQPPAAVPPAAPAAEIPVNRSGSRGPQPVTAKPAAPATPTPAVPNTPADTSPRGRGGNRPPQPANAQPPAAVPQPVTAQPAAPPAAPEAPTPPANNASRGRGGNRPPQPANAQPPAAVTPPVTAQPAAPPAAPKAATPPANNAPKGRGGNGGQNRGNAGTPDTAKTPAAPAPPANNGQGGRSGNGGQTRSTTPTPEQEPNSIVPTPAPSNAPAARGGNRGQQNP